MTRKAPAAIDAGKIESTIFTIRGMRVILDRDLAELYDVETKRLNEQVRRNKGRFPDDFAFRLTRQEVEHLRCQNGTSRPEPIDGEVVTTSRSQIATLKRGQNFKYVPWAFTEHGAIMAANVLRSRKAVEMSVFVVRAFVKMREQLGATRELARRLAEIEKELVVHDTALVDLYDKIRPLLLPPEDPPKKQIGFSVRERRARYRTGGRKK